MRERQAALIQFGLEVPAGQTGLHDAGVRFVVNVADAIQRPQVEHDSPPVCVGRALYAAPPTPGRNRHAPLVRQPDDLRDLFRGGGLHSHVGAANGLSRARRGDGVPELVIGVLLARLGLRDDVARADDARQSLC